jgi:hypothetical protein
MMHVGNMPGFDVGEGPRADLALADEVAEGRDRLLPGGIGIDPMDVVNIDVVRLQALEAGFGRLHEMPAREAAVGYVGAGGLGDLGRQHPAIALRLDGGANHGFRSALGVDVGRVDEVDAAVGGVIDDALRLRRVGRPAKHHGAEADLRHLHAAAAEHAIAHLCHV